MNDMNQILLEGTITDKKETGHGGKAQVIVTVRCDRQYRDGNGALCTESHTYDIEMYENLAETAAKTAKAGRNIRIIGRLSGCPDSRRISIICEHFEIKPAKQSAFSDDMDEIRLEAAEETADADED